MQYFHFVVFATWGLPFHNNKIIIIILNKCQKAGVDDMEAQKREADPLGPL